MYKFGHVFEIEIPGLKNDCYKVIQYLSFKLPTKENGNQGRSNVLSLFPGG